MTSTLAESVTGVKVTQGFVREDINGGLFRQLIAQHSRNNMEVVRHSAVFLPLLEFNGQLFIAILLAVGGVQALAGDISRRGAGAVPVPVEPVLQPHPPAGQPVQPGADGHGRGRTGVAPAGHAARLDRRPGRHRAARRCTGGWSSTRVSFAYGDGPPVLRGVSFLAEPGQTVALVGPTGSGKSTILGLIAKFHLPSEGQLLIDGRDIRTLTGDGLRQQMGNVLQNNFLFSGTVMDNVRIGRPAASDTGDRRRRRGAGGARSDRGPAGGVRDPGGREGRGPVAGAAADRLLLPGDAGRPAHPAAGRGHQRGRPR